MIASNGIVDIHSKKRVQEFTMEMTKQVLHEAVGFMWGRTYIIIFKWNHLLY
ncbi:hypothetical protein ACE41I_23335 [Bacillus cereus]